VRSQIWDGIVRVLPSTTESLDMRFGILLAMTLGAALLGGCTSTAKAGCKKADECNVLSGESVEGCTERAQKALDNLTSGQRSDCEKELNDCVDKSSCDGFKTCLGDARKFCPGVF
jgi:hypothetical protein